MGVPSKSKIITIWRVPPQFIKKHGFDESGVDILPRVSIHFPSPGTCVVRFCHVAPGRHQAPRHRRLPGGGRRRQGAAAQGVAGPDVAAARDKEVDHGQVSSKLRRRWIPQSLRLAPVGGSEIVGFDQIPVTQWFNVVYGCLGGSVQDLMDSYWF